MKNYSLKFCLPLLCSAMALTCQAQLQTAGTLLVNIDATALPGGPVAWVTNSGSLGGVFQATGLAEVDQPVVTAAGGGTRGILFDGHNFMEQVTAPGGTVVAAPSQLVGANPPCSIETWVVNPTFWTADLETMVAWGVRGSSMHNMAFGYSGNGDHGAVDRWGGNMGWNPVPAPAQWHHLVFTFDGTVTKIYADGVLNKSLTDSTINTTAGTPITLAAQREATGAITGTGASRGSMILSKVRIHSAPLTEAQVANNYNFEKTNFVFSPAPLSGKPAHRYTFNVAATNDAVGLTVPDVGTTPAAAAVIQGVYGSASASLTGTKIHLSGGSGEVAPYVDLPNHIISSFSSANGGPGKVTVEGWVNVTGNNAWHRLFDFGSTDVGEITGPSAPGNVGANFFMLAQVNTYRDWHQVEVNNNGFNGGPNVGTARGFELFNDASTGFGLRHYVVTWDEATGVVIVYENGILSTRMVTATKMNQIDDVNAWLGRSNFTADQNMPGDYDEFRIYGAVLTPAEVENNWQGGPDAVLVEPGALLSLSLQVARTNMVAGTFQQASVIGNFQNVTGVTVTTKPGIVFSSGNTNVFTVSSAGLLRAVSAGNATLTVSYLGQTNSVPITVSAETATLTHRYSFNGNGNDSVGGAAWAAQALNGATISSTELMLDGVGGYAQLPPGIITNLDALSVETWASFGAQSNPWGELYAFGDRNAAGQGRYYIMMAPHSGGNDARVSIADADPGFNHEQFAGAPPVLDNKSNVHVVGVYNPLAGYIALYLNGALAAINTNVTVPLSSITDAMNTIGQSIYQGDPYVNGSVNEFRIYNGPLNPKQIAIDAAAGPNQIVADPGALQSVSLAAGSPMVVNATGQALFTGTFANVANVNLGAFGPNYTSLNTNVVRVNSSGTLTAVSPGTTTIRATYGGKTADASVTVASPPATLTHRYTFNTDANDKVGTANATLMGDAQLQGGQLVLDGVNGTYADLGGNIINGYYALTFEAWASFGVNLPWVRLYDFGDQNGAGNGVTSIFFSPHTGNGNGEMTIFNTTRNDHIWPAGVGVLDNVTNRHIVCVYDPLNSTERLYFDGRLVAENRTAGVPLNTINNVNSWVGRSLFNADAYLVGNIDEFRIYNGALSPQQVAINDAAGPNTIVTNLGPLQAVRFVLNTNLLVDQQVQAQLLGDFANQSGVNLFFYGQPTVSSSDPNVLTIDAAGRVQAMGSGQATLTAIYNGVAYTKTITVSTPPATLKHRYTFDEPVSSTTAKDTVGGADASLQPGASFNGAGQMVLDGTNGYAVLPSPLVSTLSNATFEVWVTPTSAGNWQRIFDFGMDENGVGNNYVFLSARGAPGPRFTVKPPGAGEAPVLDSPSVLPVGQQSYLAGVYNWSAGRATLYINGVPVASGATVTPLSSISDINNFLGKSQYAVDALFAGSYDEFRIWDGPLQPSQVAASYAAGASGMPVPKLSSRLVNGQVELSWPGWGAGMKVQSRASLTSGQWQPVSGTPQNVGGNYTLTVPATGTGMFFRLSNQ